MNKLQTGLHLVQATFKHPKHPPIRKKKPRIPARPQGLSTKIPEQPLNNPPQPPLSFPLKSSLDVLRQRTREGLKRIEYQASRINQLSGELETAMLELKAIASQVNRDWRALQAIQHPTRGGKVSNVCEYQLPQVPNVQQKQSGAFLLTSRSVDLFKAEREAAQLAQTLRRRATRKQQKGNPHN